MIIKNPEESKELDKIPNVDENGDPIYKIDNLSEKPTEKLPILEDDLEFGVENRFKDTPQDLKDETSQE